MVGWRHQLDGHEFEQAPGVGDGQGGLACCSPWGRKESHMTQQQSELNRKTEFVNGPNISIVEIFLYLKISFEGFGRAKWLMGHKKTYLAFPCLF